MDSAGQVIFELALKVGLGTVVFYIFRRSARSVQRSFRRVAGMMLTFPILNGIGLVMTGNAGAALKASTMLPMIAVNGLVCAGYMSCFELASMRDKPRPRVALWLALAGLLVWLLVFLPAFEVPPAWQLYFIGAYSVLAIWLSIGFWAQPTKSASRNSAKHPDRAWVAGFAALLFLLLVFALVGQQFIPQIGQLSAFPILPLFGLVATAKNSDDVIRGTSLLTCRKIAVLDSIVFTLQLRRLKGAGPHFTSSAKASSVPGRTRAQGRRAPRAPASP
jgi:hypothetical protein